MIKTNNSESSISREYYDESYYKGHCYRLKRNDRFTKIKVRRVFEMLNPKPGERIVDLGVGVGTISIFLAQLGVKPIGIDFSKKSLFIAKRNFFNCINNAKFFGLCCDSRYIALKDNSIQAFAAVDFTEHIDDNSLLLTLKEIYRILEKQGRLVIYTPCKTHIFEILKSHNIILKEDKSHIGLRDMDEYINIIKECGFIIERKYFAPTHLPVFGLLEKFIMSVPFIGKYSRRRICILARK